LSGFLILCGFREPPVSCFLFLQKFGRVGVCTLTKFFS
jgi:hypothetical protein